LLDASDLSTLFTDAAGTIPVTTSGDDVGAWRNKAAGAHLFAQATAANKPHWTSGSLPYLDFNGASPHRLDATVDLSATNAVTMVVGIEIDLATDRTILNHNGTTLPYFHLVHTGVGNAVLTSGGAGGTARASTLSAGVAPQKYVISGACRIASTPLAQVYVNNTAGPATASSQGSGNYANATLRIGQRGTGINPWDGKIWTIAMFSEVLSAEDLTLVRDWTASKAGVSL